MNYADRNSAISSVNSAIAVYRYIMIFFAIINTVIVALVINYKIKSSILKGYKNIGILKAIGHKTCEIISSYMLQYLILSIIGYIIGIVLSLKVYSILCYIFELPKNKKCTKMYHRIDLEKSWINKAYNN